MAQLQTFGLISAAVLLFFTLNSVDAMRKQGVAVKGKFLCGISPAAANTTKVRIVDIDTGIDPDDTLDEKFITGNGEFKVNGYTRELTPIDPVLYVWTDCEDAPTPCHRRIRFEIPKKYIISEEPKPENWIDIGTINLQSFFEKEKRECIF